MPQAQELIKQANLFSREQIDQMLRSVTPNLDAIRSNISGNIESMTRGEIPQDVQNAVQNNAAARALGGGYAGSQAHGNLVARDLGLTSLDLTQRGLSSADAWLRSSAALYQPSMINLFELFVSPIEQAAFDVNERNTQWQWQYLREQLAAMPDPLVRGIQDSIAEIGMAALGGSHTPYYGGAGGGQAQKATGMQFGSPQFGDSYFEQPGVQSASSYNPYFDSVQPGMDSSGGAGGGMGFSGGLGFMGI